MPKNKYKEFAKKLEEHVENNRSDGLLKDGTFYYLIYRTMDVVSELMKESQLRMSHHFIKHLALSLGAFSMAIYLKAVKDEENEKNTGKQEKLAKPKTERKDIRTKQIKA